MTPRPDSPMEWRNSASEMRLSPSVSTCFHTLAEVSRSEEEAIAVSDSGQCLQLYHPVKCRPTWRIMRSA